MSIVHVFLPLALASLPASRHVIWMLVIDIPCPSAKMLWCGTTHPPAHLCCKSSAARLFEDEECIIHHRAGRAARDLQRCTHTHQTGSGTSIKRGQGC